MAVRVRYYAAARDLCGCSEEVLDLGGTFGPDVFLRAVGDRHPRFSEHGDRMRLAVNGDFAHAGTSIRDGDEVVVMPPVAGGRKDPFVELRREALSIDACVNAVRHPAAGAVSVFLGLVRNHNAGMKVSALEYEAYDELALKEMRRIVDRTMTETPGTLIAASHRIGSLSVGEIAVVVAASAPHRAEAFLASRKVIDRIKESVPIWKREHRIGAETEWINFHAAYISARPRAGRFELA
ncbi:MAG: molybdenum cofactor biosynthesis protein MoaE, partial [Myxococcales bacterium]|nr:molybdenum cofactor biosynthesis protein MoaE [Myxococcales bacterium]